MAKILDKFFNRTIEGKLVADSGDELPKELPSVSAIDNGKALVVSGGKWQAGSVGGGTQLYKHTLSSWRGSMLTENNPLVIISTSNTAFTIDSLGRLVAGTTPDFTIINIFDGNTGVKAVALSMGGYVPGGFTRLSIYYQYVNDGELSSTSKLIVEDALDVVNGVTDTVTPL